MLMLFGSHTVKRLVKEEGSFYMELFYTMSVALIMSKGRVCDLILWKLLTDPVEINK